MPLRLAAALVGSAIAGALMPTVVALFLLGGGTIAIVLLPWSMPGSLLLVWAARPAPSS